jgi:alanine dehydrogenase
MVGVGRKMAENKEDNLNMLLLSQQDLEGLGLSDDPVAIIDDVKTALVNHGTGATISEKVALSPSRERAYEAFGADEDMRGRYANEDLDVKLSALNSINHSLGAVKLIGANAMNRERGLARSEALIVLYAVDTFRPTCIMRGTEISALRTGAYAAIVGEYLMPKKTGNVVAYIGSGKMADTSIMCMEATIADRIDHVKVYSRTPANRERFVSHWQPRTKMDLVVSDSLDEAVSDADYVITATTALHPVVEDHQLKRKTTVLLLGGDEVGPQYIGRCSEQGLLFCDDWELVKHRNVQSLPMLYHKILDGDVSDGVTVDERKIHNLHMLIEGKMDISKIPHECVFVNCVGLPDLDLEVAERMYRRAKQTGTGTYFSL